MAVIHDIVKGIKGAGVLSNQLPVIAGDRKISSECNLYMRLIGVENRHFCEPLPRVYAIFRLWGRCAEKRLDVRF